MSARTWPGGYTSGWCLTGAHDRCRTPHSDAAGDCHCAACAAPLDAAVASLAPEPGATAAAPSLPDDCRYAPLCRISAVCAERVGRLWSTIPAALSWDERNRRLDALLREAPGGCSLAASAASAEAA